MAKSREQLGGSPEARNERLWRLYRNWNALATVAFAGANIVFPGSQLISIGLGLNIAQTIFGEAMRQRATSCLVFGAIHMVNLIYPLATIVPLSLGGALFMSVYLKAYRRTRFRRTAVLESSVVHRVYNRIAIGVVLLSIITAVGASLFLGGVLLLTALAILHVASFVFGNRRQFVPSFSRLARR